MGAALPYACVKRIRAEFPTAFQPLFKPRRYKVFYGGRGGVKSWSIARALLIKGSEKTLRILCARELQNSIKDSVHRLLVDQIELLGLQDIYEVTDTEIRCLVTDTLFIFKGLRLNMNAIRSLEGIDIVWVEEAEKVSNNSWAILIPTLRKPGSEIWVTFNPDQEEDPTWQRFCTPEAIAARGDEAYIIKVSYRDNPWFPEELRKEMEYDRRVDPDAAAHIWDGEFNLRNHAAVFQGKWKVDIFETPGDAHGPYQGADWGFSQDPTVLTRLWIKDKTLLIEYEAYKVGCEIEDTPALFETIPMARNYKIYADIARPETISHVRNKGFKIAGAAKWKGSVEDGVAFIRSFEQVVIHERCKHHIYEARHYSYKLDKLTGDPLAEIEDRHNHCWDADRYGLYKMIRLSMAGGRPSIRSLG